MGRCTGFMENPLLSLLKHWTLSSPNRSLPIELLSFTVLIIYGS
jgi:hypothetical protein